MCLYYSNTMTLYPSKVLHIINGWVTDTAALVEVVERVRVSHPQLLPLCWSGSSQHGVEDMEVSLHGVLTYNTVFLKEVF